MFVSRNFCLFNSLANMFDLTNSQSYLPVVLQKHSNKVVILSSNMFRKNFGAQARTSWMSSQKKGPVECHLLSSSSSSCLVGQRNLFRENLANPAWGTNQKGSEGGLGKPFGLKQGQVEWVLKKGTSWMSSWYACHHPRHLVSSGGETFSGKTFWATWVPAHARPNSLLPLLLTSSFLMPRLQLGRNCEKGLGIVLRISLLWIFSWALPRLKLHNAPPYKVLSHFYSPRFSVWDNYTSNLEGLVVK